ncbi:MAG: BACON domain-containing carbohydrate-binding protein, partial [Alistipes sp.]
VQGARATTLNFQFGRIIALGKMTIKNLDLQAAELVKTVSITAPTKVLAGRAKVDLTQGTVLEWGYAGSTTFDNIVMQYGPAQTITAKNFDAWFTCIPFALAASDKLSIVVETNKGTYTREITMTKELKFTQGNLSTFGVDMAAAIYVPTPVDSSIFTLPFGIAVKNTTYTTNYDMAATGGSAAVLAYAFSETSSQIRGNSNQFKESDYVGASSKAFWWAAAKSSLTISNITLGEGVNYALSFGAKQAATTLRVEISKDGTNFFPLAANDEPIAAAAALHTLNFHFAAAQTAAVSIRLTAGTASAVVDDVKLVALDAQGAASYLVDFMVAPALSSTPADGEALSFAASGGAAGAAPAAQSIAYTWGGGACTFAAAKAASDTWYTISDNGAGTITVTPTEYTATDKGRTGAITLTVTKAGVTAKSAVITVNQNKVGAVVKSFQLVTDVTTLAAGDKVLIVSPTASKVASTTAGAAAAFLGQVDVSIVSNAIPNVPAEATVFTVGKVGGQYTFAENTNYLNCSDKTNVSMGALDAKSNWTLTIATDGVATMEANIAAYGFLKYNSGFPRFSTYTSGQTAIALFKEQ